jgi:ferredoxin
MIEYEHPFRIVADRCDGCLACMRVCPTEAIRVKGGQARVINHLCIDCGECLSECPRHAIVTTTGALEAFNHYAFKVAVPSPVLFGQFPLEIRPEHVVQGLLSAGFDAVWDSGAEIMLATRAIADYVGEWRGPRPLISMMCPVVVRLLQVAYPRMLEQLIRLQPPRELAGREVKRHYAEALGLAPEDVAAIFVTPCQARIVSILQPAEGGRSYLDGWVGIPQIYNTVLAGARAAQRSGEVPPDTPTVRSSGVLSWSMRQDLPALLGHGRYVSVTGLPNVIHVLDDLEKGRLKHIDYLECNACWAGCANGDLTVDNVYVTQAKLRMLAAGLPDTDPQTEAEVERRYATEDLSLARTPLPRVPEVVGNLRERVQRLKEAERVASLLPELDCGLCGAPSCRVLAHDVAAGDASADECVVVGDRQLDDLRRRHRRDV